MTQHAITRFSDAYRFLSNFYPCLIYATDGVIYPSVEHAFQAHKTLVLSDREQIARLPTPKAAKDRGRTVALREDWEHVKVTIMAALLRIKFADPELRRKLLETGDALLVEGNSWGDNFWGVHKGSRDGKNYLGRLLMLIRDDLTRS